MSEGNRTSVGARLFAAACAACLFAFTAGTALANGPPRREGDIWGWRKHQPTQGAVSAKEHAAGVALPPQAKVRTNTELDRLDRQLLSRGSPGVSGGVAGQAAR